MILGSREILESAPCFVAAVDPHRYLALNGGDLSMAASQVYIPQPVSAQRVFPPSTAPLKGLRNDANACFLNAVVVALTSLVDFAQTTHPCDLSKNCPMCSFLKLAHKLQHQDGRVTLAKSSCAKLLAASHPALDFSGKSQGDATRFLTHVLDWLIKSELASHAHLVKKPRSVKPQDALIYSVDDDLLALTTNFGRLFSYVVRTSVLCSACNGVVERREVWRSLPIYPQNGKSFNALVNQRFNDQPVAAYSQCSHCKKEAVDVTVTSTLLSNPPFCLVQAVRRAAGGPSILDVTDGFQVVSETLGSLKYSVVGAICHKNKHYFTVVRRGASWFKISDETVKTVESASRLEQMLGAEATVFICEGKLPHWFDQQEKPMSYVKYEEVSEEVALAEKLRVLNEDEQVATGIGIEKPVFLDLVAFPANSQAQDTT